MNKQELLAALKLSEQQRGLINTLHLYYGANIKVSLGYSRSACMTSVDELFFSVRSQNALKRASIFTVGDVIDALNDGQIEKIRNLGRKSVSEIKTRMLLFGFEELSEREQGRFFCSLMELNPEKTAALCGSMEAI